MQKLQILFPEPQLSRLREIANKQDRPVSELIRESVQMLLSRYPDSGVSKTRKPPTYHGGPVKISAREFRKAAYSDRS